MIFDKNNERNTMKILLLLIIGAINFGVFSDAVLAVNNAEKNPALALSYYRVHSVSPDDTLSLRVAPDKKSKIVMQLPYNSTGILKLNDSGKWIEVSYSGKTGWAYGRYLKLSTPPSVTTQYAKELFCFGGEPHWLLKTKRHKIIFTKFNSETIYWLNSSIQFSANAINIYSFSAIDPKKKYKFLRVITTHNKQCNDGMRDKTYPFSAIILYNNEILSGCCQ